MDVTKKMSTPLQKFQIAKCQLEALNSVRMVGFGNLLALVLMIVFLGIAVATDWTSSCIALGIIIGLTLTVVFNLRVMYITEQGILYENKILLYILYLACILVRKTKLGYNWIRRYGGFGIWGYIFRCMKSVAKKCSTRSSERVSLKERVNTPDSLQKKNLKPTTIEKANSDPVKKLSSCINRKENSTSNNARNRGPTKTPELFKNKIYQTRRTLINAQDELFNDKVNMF